MNSGSSSRSAVDLRSSQAEINIKKPDKRLLGASKAAVALPGSRRITTSFALSCDRRQSSRKVDK